MMLVCVNKNSSSTARIVENAVFCVNTLSPAHEGLADVRRTDRPASRRPVRERPFDHAFNGLAHAGRSRRLWPGSRNAGLCTSKISSVLMRGAAPRASGRFSLIARIPGSGFFPGGGLLGGSLLRRSPFDRNRLGRCFRGGFLRDRFLHRCLFRGSFARRGFLLHRLES